MRSAGDTNCAPLEQAAEAQFCLTRLCEHFQCILAPSSSRWRLQRRCLRPLRATSLAFDVVAETGECTQQQTAVRASLRQIAMQHESWCLIQTSESYLASSTWVPAPDIYQLRQVGPQLRCSPQRLGIWWYGPSPPGKHGAVTQLHFTSVQSLPTCDQLSLVETEIRADVRYSFTVHVCPRIARRLTARPHSKT